jgi:2'-5' RNA ligase
VRLFVAINLPDALRQAAFDASAPLREAVPRGVGWVVPERLHLTVKFLGEQPESVVDPLAAALAEVAALHSQLSLELEGVGAFPNFRRPRVVWLGVRPDPKLELLHHDVEVGCAGLGFEVEGRAFRPHLTLGRVRLGLTAESGRSLAAAARTVHFRERASVPSLDLMRSELAPGGSRYTVLARAMLRDH